MQTRSILIPIENDEGATMMMTPIKGDTPEDDVLEIELSELFQPKKKYRIKAEYLRSTEILDRK